MFGDAARMKLFGFSRIGSGKLQFGLHRGEEL